MVVGRKSPQILGPVGAVHLVGGAVVGVEAVALATDAGTALIAPTHLERTSLKSQRFFFIKSTCLHCSSTFSNGIHMAIGTSVPVSLAKIQRLHDLLPLSHAHSET